MLHRDDVPFERIEEIERQLREQTGNQDEKLFFPGDVENLPKDVLHQIKQIEELSEESVNRGFCIDCLQAMPSYRPWEEDWRLDGNWMCLAQLNGEPAGWLCPGCVEMMCGDDGDIDENERWTITDDELEGDFE